MSTHTPEPWTAHLPASPKDREASLDSGIAAVVNHEKKIIAEAFGQVEITNFAPAKANADRIVACVNGCAGIADPAELRTQRDELLAACKDLEASLAPYRGPDCSPTRTYLCSRAAIGTIRTAITKAEEGGT